MAICLSRSLTRRIWHAPPDSYRGEQGISPFVACVTPVCQAGSISYGSTGMVSKKISEGKIIDLVHLVIQGFVYLPQNQINIILE